MQHTTRAIVLSAIKYGDTSLIVRAFTASGGVKAYLLRGVLSSKKGRLKSAYFQPLTQLELVVSHRDKGTLEHIREAKISYPYCSLHSQIGKNTLCLFLAEVVQHSIQEEERNQKLFAFLEASLQWLDAHEAIANFHILFLMELSKYLGFYPDTSQLQLPFFDLAEGRFLPAPSLNPGISGIALDHFRAFLGMDFDALHSIKLGKTNRITLLQALLQYYEIHLHGFRKPRSLAILNEVFS